MEMFYFLNQRLENFRYRTIEADDRRQGRSIDELVSNDGTGRYAGAIRTEFDGIEPFEARFPFDRGWTGERPRPRDRTGPTVAISGSISSRLERTVRLAKNIIFEV